tara:strand:- start:9694 stop:9999 length:306 start_codon:yes stop_codon:yes gene_type:complete
MTLTLVEIKQDIASRLSRIASLYWMFNSKNIIENMTISNSVTGSHIDIDMVLTHIGPVSWGEEIVNRVKRVLLNDNENNHVYGTITKLDDRTLRIYVGIAS